MFFVIRSYKNAYMMHTVSNKCGIREHSVLWAYLKRHQGNRKTFLHFSFKGCCHEMWICICNSVNNKFVSAGSYQWLPFVSNKDRKRLQIEQLSSSLFELVIVSFFIHLKTIPLVLQLPLLQGRISTNGWPGFPYHCPVTVPCIK